MTKTRRRLERLHQAIGEAMGLFSGLLLPASLCEKDTQPMLFSNPKEEGDFQKRDGRMVIGLGGENVS